jgi:hypothetical protein
VKAFFAHAREHWKAVLLVALLAAVIGALLPMWASVPINAALGWTLGSWPAGLKIGPLLLMQDGPATEPDLLTVAAWRLSMPLKPGDWHWFVGAYRVEADRSLHLTKWWSVRLVPEHVPKVWGLSRSWTLLTRYFDLQLGIARIGRPAEA